MQIVKSTFIGNNQFMGLSTEDFFWQKVDKGKENECWNWMGSVHYMWGYGHFRANGKQVAAHRYSWILVNGNIPKGLCVCHKCDNPKCVNPSHLFLGTVADNNLDKKLKGRQPPVIGEKNPRAKLTEENVREIRRLHILGESGASLGRKFGVVKEEIYDIVKRKRWSCVQ
jgi:hypothetical protein